MIQRKLVPTLLALLLAASARAEDMSALWTAHHDLGGHEFLTGAIELNGNILLSGASTSLDITYGDMAVLCLSPQGDSLWTRYYGTEGMQFSDAICNYESGFVLVGYSTLDVEGIRSAMIVRCDASGDTIWTRTFEHDGVTSHALGILELSNHRLLILGYERHSTVQYGWLCCMSGSGDTLWTKRQLHYGWDTFVDAVEADDGSIYIGGTTQQPPMDNYVTADMQLVHISSDGDSLESRVFGGADRERFYSLDQFADGRMIIAGYTQSLGDYMADAYHISTDPNGNPIWSRTYGGEGMDHSHDGIVLSDGTIFTSGHAESMGGSHGGGDFYSIRTDADGNQLETGFYGGMNWENSEAVLEIGNKMLSAGYTNSFSETYDFGAVAYNYLPLDVQHPGALIPAKADVHVFPNPFNQSATVSFEIPQTGKITLQVFDITGRHVQTLFDGIRAAGVHVMPFDGARLASGAYFIQLNAAGSTTTLKSVLLK